MDSVVSLVENRIPNEKVLEMYKNEEISRAECLLLLATEKDAFLNKFISGTGEFKLYYDRNIDPELYFTNVEDMLGAFYSLHEKYPDYHFDKLLEEIYKKSAKVPGYVLYIVSGIMHHLKDSKNNTSTFKLENIPEILDLCKGTIMSNMDYYKEMVRPDAYNRKNGLYDMINEYSESIKEEIGYDMFDHGSI